MICKLFNKCVQIPIPKNQETKPFSLKSFFNYFKKIFLKIYLYFIATIFIVFVFKSKIKDLKNWLLLFICTFWIIKILDLLFIKKKEKINNTKDFFGILFNFKILIIPFAVCIGWLISQIILNLGIQYSLDEYSKKSNNFQQELKEYLNNLLKIFNLDTPKDYSLKNLDIPIKDITPESIDNILNDSLKKNEYLENLCNSDIVQKKLCNKYENYTGLCSWNSVNKKCVPNFNNKYCGIKYK